jgi:hypothetical protein
MNDFVTLSCPSCGGKLQISGDINRFTCASCGNEHIVNRSGGVISVSPVVNELKKINSSVGSTAAELAIVRIDKEILNLQKKIQEVKVSGSGCKGCASPILVVIFLFAAFVFFSNEEVIYGFVLLACCPYFIYLTINLKKEYEAEEENKNEKIRSIEAEITKLIQEREDLINSIKSQ